MTEDPTPRNFALSRRNAHQEARMADDADIPPARSRRADKPVVLLLLGVPALLWILLILRQLGVVDIFGARLMKFPGPWVTLGVMALGPLAAALLGLRQLRARRSPVLGRAACGLGTLLFVAFVGAIGIPMTVQAFREKPPKNPSTPRPLAPQTGLPCFPGAEGFGTRTPAGRGGKVLEVTTLADAGPGSLREAIDTPGPRTIVFRVGGTIELGDFLYIKHPFVTIAGQTAPGDGICIKNAGLVVMTHDVLIRYLRVRPGNEGPIEPDNNDAVAILGKTRDIPGAHHVVLDHVSASWGEDETISTWFGAHDVTISWCIISEALDRSRHRKGGHSAGLLIGDSSYNVTVHHTLLAHNGFRNPLIQHGGTHDIVNNVIYDWGNLAAEIGDTDSNSFINFVGNTYRRGPSTLPESFDFVLGIERSTPRLFMSDNRGTRRPDAAGDDWALVSYRWKGTAPPHYRSADPFPAPPVTTQPCEEAFELVLAGAGAVRPKRDAVDARIVQEVRTRTGRIIHAPADVGGYPKLAGAEPPPDADHDGMPDAWEIAHELDPHDPSDAAKDADGDGYTNLEAYLNELKP
jgi:pectate lyase